MCPAYPRHPPYQQVQCALVSVGVVIVAGGRGARLGGDVPKQFLDLGGRTILQRSVAAFDVHPEVDAIVVVLPLEHVGRASDVVGPLSRPYRVVAGGSQRHDSVREGVSALDAHVDVVLIHDAARPFVDGALIDRVIAATRDRGAAVPGVPARDTVKRVQGPDQVVSTTIPRSEIWLAQTPQGFTRPVLEDVLARGGGVASATDEAMLAEEAGHPVAMVAGDETNVKITTTDDLRAARARIGGAPRVGTGYDLHRLVAGRPLVLAGVVLPADVGPDGHSDGDVVCHALVDAIFGAAAIGDIGRHFPNTDARWKDAAGLDLLARGIAIVSEHGWRPASADVTVVLERPKLVPHVDEIRRRLATVLGLAASAVSVKGKTNEGVDAVGRGEAIAAHAIAVLVGVDA
jgi:2-C-methyl-D-erythritol 4-phosphate cytidylyltransferase/2-C-methyl-D-erythritol 2,4-cyclodiphosphate synthase